MNKEEMIEQIDDLKQKLEELEKQVNSIEIEGIKEGVRWKPEYDKKYYFLSDSGSITFTYWFNLICDSFRFNIGNCFKTQQEAEEYKENLITKQALKDLALELNNGVEIDWNDLTQQKFYLECAPIQNKLDDNFANGWVISGTIFCLNEDFLPIAKDRIGEEKLIKLIKSGV